ncbi:redoxin family protein [Bythopirellula goksoeyrii]|uniref:Thiol-disulfide oxidoreductase ResA n=1 Tax=Bythopirellula goksoeyrii TaxID=1400387 RepID=A0A5B9Q8V5_9BACT|nr:thioredoxin-like domain-containing protein [Bythopirellula goksoeyrii]QEG33346.1 Thiol-disulfide oxidoreductase ResA [Bythopirellula goksoeyrii]
MNCANMGRSLVFGLAVILVVGACWAAERNWTDESGKFSITAEYVGVKGGKVLLRNADGKELSVPLKKLSEADREFVKAQQKEAAQREEVSEPTRQKPQREVVMELAETFYADLRTRERIGAGKLLTDEAQALIKTGKSPLVYLPRPEVGGKAIRVGRPKFDGSVAEIPVRVEAGEQLHQTWLHLRLVNPGANADEDWRIFALSAVYPDGEKSLDFEASVALAGEADPLKKLIGKPFLMEGYTLDGEPISSDDYKGKVVLIDFWATWCGPCKAEIPNILDNWRKYNGAGFEVLAVSVDKDLEALASFTRKENPPWTVVADRHPYNKKSMGAKFGIRSIPAFVLLGRDGRVAAIHCRGKLLSKEVERLLAGG